MKRGGSMRARSPKREKANKLRRPIKAAMFDETPWCARCGWSTTDIAALDLHELRSRAQGGSILDRENLRLLCRPCHDLVTFKHYELEDAHLWRHTREAS